MPPAAAPLCQSKLPAYPFFPPPTILTLVCSDAQPHCMPVTFFPPAKIYPLFDSKLIWAFAWLLVHVSKTKASLLVSLFSARNVTRVWCLRCERRPVWFHIAIVHLFVISPCDCLFVCPGRWSGGRVPTETCDYPSCSITVVRSGC